MLPLYVGRGHRSCEIAALVDDEDFERLSAWKWSPRVFNGITYAIRQEGTARPKNHPSGYSKSHVVLMHREVLRATPDQMVDHVNRVGIDNRKENLRFASRQGNAANSKKKAGSSRFKGVYWDAMKRKWTARIHVDYRAIWLGRFDDEVMAARAYDTAARHHFREFARTNFPNDKGV